LPEIDAPTQTLVTIDTETGVHEVEDLPEDNEENRAILNRIDERKTHITNEWWNLAGDLFEVQKRSLHRLAGYQNIEDYFCSIIDNTARYAFDLTSMYKYYTVSLPVLLVDRPEIYSDLMSKVKSLGVTKAKEITRGKIKDPDTLIEVINQASTPNQNGRIRTVDEIKTLMLNYKETKEASVGEFEAEKERKAEDEKKLANKKETFKFKLPFGQAEKVNDVLRLILTKYGMEDNDKERALAFFRICEEWSIENQADTEGVRPGIEADLKRLEEIYSVRIVAFPSDRAGNLLLDDEGLSFKFGEETFRQVVEVDEDDK
jgi:hypothetical protein